MELPPTEPPAIEPLVQMADIAVASAHSLHSPVLERVTWSIARGDFWIIGGPPDSGKSDLLATAAGLCRPMSGSYRLWGRELKGTHGDELLRERLRLGLVFADGGRLFHGLTVLENVALPWCYHHNGTLETAAPQVQALLDGLNLTFLAHYPCGRLSRVWRQRVALARALMLKPEILFLDNPLPEGNRPQSEWWLKLLADLWTGHPFLEGRPMTLVVATDNLRPWRHHGRQFAVLKQRRWTIVGGPDDLAASAREDPVLKELLAEPLEST